MPHSKGSEKDFLVTESKHDDYSATLQSNNVRLSSLVDQNPVSIAVQCEILNFIHLRVSCRLGTIISLWMESCSYC